MSAPAPVVANPSTAELQAAACLERSDRVPGDPATSAFKRSARLHQARWREAHGFPMGTQPINAARPRLHRATGEPIPPRPIGSNLEFEFARETRANFLSDRVGQTVADRLAHRQTDQMLDEDRLFASLLSSMPMCFNLFGWFASPSEADAAVKAWWPDTPGTVAKVIFEWSPCRRDPAYLGNRSAFDVAFILDLGGGRHGVLGVETKYHEHPTPVGIRSQRVDRYREVAEHSGRFDGTTIAHLLGGAHTVPPTEPDPRSQIWLDHLLALSIEQHADWDYARFVVVYPDANPSWAQLVADYGNLVGRDDPTFAASTFDELVAAGCYEASYRDRLVERYRCWGPSPTDARSA
jgi:hypothetical protein